MGEGFPAVKAASPGDLAAVGASSPHGQRLRGPFIKVLSRLQVWGMRLFQFQSASIWLPVCRPFHASCCGLFVVVS